MKVLLTGCWLVFVILVYSCRKEDPPTIPVVESTTVTDITQTTATAGGQIVSDGGKPITKRGVCWGETNQPTTNDSKTTDGAGDGSFVSSITDLTPGVLYYVRAYATNGVGTGYGDPVSFKTKPVAQAEVTTTVISEVTATSAKTGGTIVSNGGGEITACGVCWSLNHEPVIIDNNNKTTDVLSGNTYTSTLSNLDYFKTYYVRAYATNSAGTVYGNEREFKTSAVPPRVITGEITNRSYRSATAGGEVTADGGNPVTDKGICFATHTNPKFNENNKNAGNGLGSFTVDITGLDPNNIYHVRAYAATNADTTYGADVEFKTLESGVPQVTTKPVIWIISDYIQDAQTGGEVVSENGSPVTERGVCWSTQIGPTINDRHTIDGSGSGDFNSALPGYELFPPQQYHVRAYAKNSAGIGYGQDESFYSECMSILHGVEVINITGTSAEINCIASNFMGIRYDVRNTKTGTIQTFYNNLSVMGGPMSVSQSLSSLEFGTLYKVNVMTESYCVTMGAEISFTTLNKPTLTTKGVTSITSNSAVSGGIISMDGGSPVTERGICWSINENPEITGDHISAVNGTGEFSATITGLDPGQSYHVRAYAINNVGIAYGQDMPFITDLEKVIDIDGNSYEVVKIGEEIWMAENLRTTKYNDGTPIPYLSDPADYSASYCWYNNDMNNKNVYGALYNAYAMRTNKLCPTGWDVPTIATINALVQYLGGTAIAGGKLKEEGTGLWMSPNAGATNSSKFSGLPGGFRTVFEFEGLRYYGYWWLKNYNSTTPTFHDCFYLMYDSDDYYFYEDYSSRNQISVRCIKK